MGAHHLSAKVQGQSPRQQSPPHALTASRFPHAAFMRCRLFHETLILRQVEASRRDAFRMQVPTRLHV